MTSVLLQTQEDFKTETVCRNDCVPSVRVCLFFSRRGQTFALFCWPGAHHQHQAQLVDKAIQIIQWVDTFPPI